MKVFRNSNSVRLDFEWYGFGKTDFVYISPVATVPGKKFWINSYRRAPISFRFLDCLGFISRPPKGWFFFTGSINEPKSSWRFRIWKLFIGGDTPKWIQKLIKDREYRRMVHLAKKDRFFLQLCPKCLNGVIEETDGFPGEYFVMCRNCGHIFDSYINMAEIE